MAGDELVIVRWASWSELAAQVDLQHVALAIAPLDGDIAAFVVSSAPNEYHLIFGVGAGTSLIFEGLKRVAVNVPKLILVPRAHQAIQTIFSNAAHLLGA